MKSKVISLCAISAAFVAIALTIGTYFEITDLFMLVVASVFVLLPLYFNSYIGSFLTYLAGGVIAFLLSGFSIALIYPAFFGFFGLYPIIKNKMMQKNVRKVICIFVGLIWFVAVAYGCYFYYTLILNGIIDGIPKRLLDYVIYGVGIVAIIFFFIYDKMLTVVKIVLDRYLARIIK